jgi:hypothetical protein
MSKEVTVYQANPVLTRFVKIRSGWLGLLGSDYRRGRRKNKANVFVKWLGRLISPLVKSVKRRLNRELVKLQRRVNKFFRRAANLFLNGLIAASLVAAIFWLGPRVFYRVFPPEAQPAQAEELTGDFQLKIDETALARKKVGTPLELSQPPFNENLPVGDWLIIPRIGVRSTLQPTENYEEALTTGIWLDPHFGRPGDRKVPMIVAGHRFGFQWWWQDDYWKYHSFYLLPDLEPGDKIEVISGQRKYSYEIYAGEEGSEITDYQADLIVYTCKFLDSPIRIFRYAKLVAPEGETPLGGIR